jgi:hypothetical protein
MKARFTLWAVGGTAAIATLLTAAPAAAQADLCFMQTSTGQVVNLEALCAASQPQPVPQGAAQRQANLDVDGLIAAFGVNANDIDAFVQAYAYSLVNTPGNQAVTDAIGTGGLDPVVDGLEYCAGLANGEAPAALRLRLASQALNAGTGNQTEADSLNAAATHYAVIESLAPTYLCR